MRTTLVMEHVLISNFEKICNFINKECPNITGEFCTKHKINYWVRLKVDNNLIRISEGDHSSNAANISYDSNHSLYIRISKEPIPNTIPPELVSLLECVLSEWHEILKPKILEDYRIQSNIYSKNFEA